MTGGGEFAQPLGLKLKHFNFSQVNRHLERYIALLEDCKERDAVREMLSISRLGNQLMHKNDTMYK